MSGWPHDACAPVSAGAVAARLGMASVRSLYRNRARLRARGFPEPCLGRRWTAGQIDGWIDAQMRLAAHAAAPRSPANDGGALPPLAVRRSRARIRALCPAQKTV